MFRPIIINKYSLFVIFLLHTSTLIINNYSLFVIFLLHVSADEGYLRGPKHVGGI